jgi:hypothetical protein
MQKRAIWLFLLISCLMATVAGAQTFRVECPAQTPLHPLGLNPSYMGPQPFTDPTTGLPYIRNGGAIKCQHISGGDGYSTMADGHQTYMFSFGPLSGLQNIENGLPGTVLNSVFNKFSYPTASLTSSPIPDPVSPNGAVADPANIMNIGVLNGSIPAPTMAIDEDDEFYLTLSNVGMIMRPDLFEQHTVHFHGYPNASSFFDGVPDASVAIQIAGSFSYYYLAPDAGTYFWHCHITPPEHLQMGMVGQLWVRPRQNRVKGGTQLSTAFGWAQTDPRTACIPSQDILCATPPPVANTVTQPNTPTTYAYNDGDGSTRYDIELPLQIHGFDPNFHYVGMTFNPEGFEDMKDKYFLLNGRSYPDTVNTTGNNSEVAPAQATASADGVSRPSQPLSSTRTVAWGQKILLRISMLGVTEYQTLASQIPMQVIALNARLLRDQAGNNMYYTTNSITLGGGESLDVILDTSLLPRPAVGAPNTYFLFTPQLDHLSNDAENFGGLMTEIVVTN